MLLLKNGWLSIVCVSSLCCTAVVQVYGQYYDYQTRGVNSQNCPEDEFQLRALDCECSLVEPTRQPPNNHQLYPENDPNNNDQNQDDEDEYYNNRQQSSNNNNKKRPKTTTTSSPVNPQRVILGCVGVDSNKFAQLLRRITQANYALASLTLENAQLRGTRSLSSLLPQNIRLEDELTIRNTTLGDQALNELLTNLPAAASGRGAALQRLTLNRVGITRVPKLSASQAERLSTLNLEDNQIGSLDADDFRDMPSLQALHLSRNEIQSIDAETFAQNPLLSNLQLDGNQLESLPNGVFRANAQLGQLSLRANRFRSLPNDVFDGLENGLYHLNLAENELQSLPPALMSRLGKLEGLNIGSNRIRDVRLSPELSHLRTLEVSNNSMNALPDGLEYMSKLEQLVSNNNNIRVIPKLPPALKNLQYVSLYQSNVEHICPEAFQNVPSVQHIHLDGHNLTTIPSSAFSGLTPLAVSLASSRAALVCDCRVAWLSSWIQSGVLQYPDYVMCAGPPGSEMENQPLSKISTLSCPYVPDSDLDVPPECYANAYNNNNNNNNNDNDDMPYYPGSRARNNNINNNNNDMNDEQKRQREIQQQLDRIQPSRWPTYVHTDRQGMSDTDVDNDETGGYRNEPHETYQANISPTSSNNNNNNAYDDSGGQESDEDQEQHQYRIEPTNEDRTRDSSSRTEYDDNQNQRPTINGYGHSQPTTHSDDNDDEADHENYDIHRHHHGPGATTERMDPNDVMQEALRRQEEDEARQRAAMAGATGGQHPNIDDEAAWRRPTVDPDDDNEDSTNHSSSSSDGAAPASGNSNMEKSDAQQQQPNSAAIILINFAGFCLPIFASFAAVFSYRKLERFAC